MSFARLQAVAESGTESELQDNIAQLLIESDEKIETWLQRKWLPHKEVWFFLLLFATKIHIHQPIHGVHC